MKYISLNTYHLCHLNNAFHIVQHAVYIRLYMMYRVIDRSGENTIISHIIRP